LASGKIELANFEYFYPLTRRMKIKNLFECEKALQEITKIALEAEKDENPTLHFFQNKARDYFFDLEAICRILRKTLKNNDKASDLRDVFKVAEDALGQYDFILFIHDSFSSVKNLSTPFIEKIKLSEKKAQVELKQFLKTNHWLPYSESNIKEYEEQLNDLLDTDYEKFRSDFIDYLSKSLLKVDLEYRKGELDPHQLEEGVHEIRRKIRWISIYAKVSGGAIQCIESKSPDQQLMKYKTASVMNSPFIKLPENTEKIQTINFRFENYIALSWMIDKLGELKDQGQLYESIINFTKKVGFENDRKLLLDHFKFTENTLKEISEKSLSICDTFFIKDDILKRINDDIHQT